MTVKQSKTTAPKADIKADNTLAIATIAAALITKGTPSVSAIENAKALVDMINELA